MNKKTNTIRMISARTMAVAATTKRVAMTLLLAVLTTATAWADNNDPIISGYTATAGTAGATNSEGYACLVDDNPRTKWCVKSSSCSIEFETANAFVPTGYVMTTASDNSSYTERRPKSWTIEAKANSNDSWTTIATVTNNSKVDEGNCRDTEFTLSNTNTAYRFFRLEITAVQSESKFQLAEFRFKGHNATVANKQYIKDVMLIGGDQSTVNSLKTTYQNQGWTVLNYNLNQGVGGDYIYLLYKYDTSKAANFSYISELYLRKGGTPPDKLTHDSRTFYLVAYDGSSDFKNYKANLNNGVSNSDQIHLYYTKSTFNSTYVSSLSVNTTQSGAIGEGGGSTGYSLNAGKGNAIYLHATTATANTYTAYIVPGYSGETPYRVFSDSPEYIAASKTAAQNKQFYKDTDGSIGFKLEPTFDDGMTNGINFFNGWGHGDVTYHTLTSTLTTFTAQWDSPEYSVTVKDNVHADLQYYTMARLVTTTKEQAQNMQFYKDTDGSIGFMLARDYTPFSADGFYFLNWGNNSTYHKLAKGATTFSAVGWKYEDRYNGRTITGYCPAGNELTIDVPSIIGGVYVKQLDLTIKNLETLRYVYFYQNSQFNTIIKFDCPNVKYIYLPENLSLGCSLPNSVTTIESIAFNGTAIEQLRMPGVKDVGLYAFTGSKFLSRVTFDSEVSIRGGAFINCTSLTDVIFSEGALRLESNAFEGCRSLKTLELKDNLERLYTQCFKDCKSFTDLYYDGTKTQWDAVEKDNGWDESMPSGWKLHWRCTVSFDTNGRGTTPSAQTVWSNESANVEKPIFVSDDGYVCTKWFTDAACTTEWNFSTDLVPGDMTLYAGGWEAPLSIYDNAINNLTNLNGQTKNLKLQGRTLYCDDKWNTICLPFTLTSLAGTPLEGFTVMELDKDNSYNGHKTGFEDGTLYLNFSETNSIYAGQPYIIKKASGSNISNPLFLDVSIDSAEPTAVTSDDGKVSFVGSFSPVDLTANDKSVLYLGAGNTLYWPSTAKTIGSCRAYFQLNGLSASTPTAAVRDFVLNFDSEENTTGIVSTTNLTNYTNSAGAGWYDLSGRKLSGKPTKKGLYINNGRKVVIK